MFRISLAYFMRLGEEISRLRSRIVDGAQLSDVRHILWSARRTLSEVQSSGILRHAMNASYVPLNDLLGGINSVLGSDQDDTDRTLDFMDEFSVGDPLKRFYAVFSAEFEVADAYLVFQKRGYDTKSLLFTGESIFPEDLITKVPGTLEDVRAAGRCLAFELGTASGFHTLRALEAVLVAYWHKVIGGKDLPEPRNLGNTLNCMTTQKVGDEKIISALKQIKDLHRNPLMHPEVHLNMTEAISLVGMAQSCMRAMLAQIPETAAVTTPSF